MATREELVAALKAADAAGDTHAAQKLVAAITNYSDENNIPSPPPAGPPAPDPGALDPNAPMWQKMLQYPADTGRLIGNGVTLGGYDALMGQLAPLIGGSDTAGQRALTAGAEARGGVAGQVVKLGSSMVPAALTDGATAAPVLGNGLKGALLKLGVGMGEGAGYGGIQSVMEGNDPLLGMGSGAVAGGAGHAVAGLLSKAGSKVSQLFGGAPPRMTVPNLAAAKDQAYQAVENAGVEYTPGAIRGMLADMNNSVNPYPGRHDQVIAARDHVNDRLGTNARPVTLPEVDLNRQIIKRDLASLPDAPQQGMGLDMAHSIDTTLNNVGPLGVTARSGDPAEGAGLINDARNLNSRLEKAQDITGVEYKANLQSAKSKTLGFDDTAKNNLTSMLTSDKRMRGYTPEERAQMETVVTGGGPFSKTNVARQLGRMAPGGGLSFGGGGLGAAVGGLLSGGNPTIMTAAGLAPAAIGYVGKKVSERGTRQAFNDLMDLVANGKANPAPPKMDPADRDRLGKLFMMMQLQHQ